MKIENSKAYSPVQTAQKDFLIVALDFPEANQALQLVDNLGDSVSFYKVGLELFCSSGHSIIDALKSRNKSIFLDLKLNDIPKTIERTVMVLGKMGVQLLTLFCDPPSIAAARRAADELQASGYTAPRLLNITVLTSMSESDLTQSGINVNIAARVQERARLSREFGAHGVVCSGEEVGQMRIEFESNFILVTPGIRLLGGELGDQKRVFSPGRAFQAGSSHIVVGRPVRDAAEPVQVVEEIWDDINNYGRS